MTSVNATVPARMDLWAIDKLFGSTETDQSSPAPPSDSIVAIASGQSVSAATIEAIASLPPHGKAQVGASTKPLDASTTDDTKGHPAPESGQHRWTVDDANAVAERLCHLSSQEVSDAMYGDGLPDTSGSGMDTFRQFIAGCRETQDWLYQMAAKSDNTAEDRDRFYDEASRENAITDGIEQAYNNHSLVIQNARDVKGLDDNEQEVFHQVGTGTSQWGYTEITGGWNRSFGEQNPNPNSQMIFFGAVPMYITW